MMMASVRANSFVLTILCTFCPQFTDLPPKNAYWQEGIISVARQSIVIERYDLLMAQVCVD